MDLGDLLGKGLELYGQYKAIEMQQPVIQAQPAYDSPFIPNVVERAAPWFIDEATGMVVQKKKRCRRRRRRLATASDLRDLAALQGILGNGKNFQVWIATHSR